jgi:CRP/FNR family transcriptional regulator, anaerobic regulatory protein
VAKIDNQFDVFIFMVSKPLVMMDHLSLRKIVPLLDTELIKEISSTVKIIEVEGDTQLLDTGSYVHAVPLVVKGLVKVSRRDEDRELLLYHIHPGELCIMSFSACCNNSTSMIVATATEATTLLLLPADQLRNWLQNYPSLNTFVYNQFNSRYLDLMDTINQLVFNRLDERLLHFLEEKFSQSKDTVISITHQQIANDLGTAREVVSRLMKKLEREGKIEQGRNQVKLIL